MTSAHTRTRWLYVGALGASLAAASPVLADDDARCDATLPADIATHLASTHPALAAMDHAAQELEAKGRTAAAYPDPAVRFDVRGAPLVEPWNLGRTPMGGVGVGVSQALPSPFKLNAERDALGHLAEAKAALRDESRLALVARALSYLVSIEQAARQIALLDETKALYLTMAEVARAKAAVSAQGSEQAVLLEASALRLDAKKEALHAAQEAARARYLALVGEGGPAPCRLALASETTLDTDDDASKRPAVEALEARARAAESKADAAAHDWLPTTKVSAGYVWRPAQQSGGDDVDFLAGAIEIPLPLSWEKRTGPAASAKAQRSQALAERAAFLRHAKGELDAARARVERETATLRKLTEEVVPVTKSAAEVARSAYESGRGSLAPVLESERLVLDVELSVVEAEARRDQALLEYWTVVGEHEALFRAAPASDEAK